MGYKQDLALRDTRPNHTTTGLALWSSLTLETRSHPWVLAGHIHSTRVPITMGRLWMARNHHNHQENHCALQHYRIFLTEFFGFRRHVVATTVCTTGGVRTLTCCTHIFLLHSVSAHIRTLLMRVTHTHGSRVPKRFFARVSFLSISLSPVSCLTHPCCSRTVTFPKSAGHAHLRTSSEKFGYLAKSALNTCWRLRIRCCSLQDQLYVVWHVSS